MDRRPAVGVRVVTLLRKPQSPGAGRASARSKAHSPLRAIDKRWRATLCKRLDEHPAHTGAALGVAFSLARPA
jgi:hypothetical protein